MRNKITSIVLLMAGSIVFAPLIHSQEAERIVHDQLVDTYPSLVLVKDQMYYYKDQPNRRIVVYDQASHSSRIIKVTDLEESAVSEFSNIQVASYSEEADIIAAQIRSPDVVVFFRLDGSIISKYNDVVGTLFFDFFEDKIFLVPFSSKAFGRMRDTSLIIFDQQGSIVETRKLEHESEPLVFDKYYFPAANATHFATYDRQNNILCIADRRREYRASRLIDFSGHDFFIADTSIIVGLRAGDRNFYILHLNRENRDYLLSIVSSGGELLKQIHLKNEKYPDAQPSLFVVEGEERAAIYQSFSGEEVGVYRLIIEGI